MNFSVYLPAAAIGTEGRQFPVSASFRVFFARFLLICKVIYYLSGLTCTDLNCVEKSGVQRLANENNVIIVFPDTSPRGLGYPGEAESWDFGIFFFF